MSLKRQYGEIQPGLRWGPFTARVPLFHTRMEWPDLLQGIVVAAATGLALVPLLQNAFGLTFEEAIACSMIHALLITSAPILFGEPFAPGWITPALPITLAFVLGNYSEPTERFQAMTAVSLEFSAILLFFGITGLGKRFADWLPAALKAGIIMGASIAAFKRVFLDDIDSFMRQPIATGVAIVVCLIFAFSRPFDRYKAKYKSLAMLANLGLLPGFLCAALVGYLTGEVEFNISWGVLIPAVDGLWAKASPFVIGWPTLEMYAACFPLALIGYTILFGDLITGIEVIKDAQSARPDETIDIDIHRTHSSLCIRNFLMAVLAPFFPTQGILWTGVHVIIVQRWRQGSNHMDSLFGGISSYNALGLPLLYFCLPLILALAPLMNIALSLTLVLTGFACAYVAMAIPQTPEERGVVVLTGIALAIFAPWLGLIIGLAATMLLVGFDRKAGENSTRDVAREPC